MAAARAPRWPCPPAAIRRRRPTSTMTHALFDIGPRFSCPVTLAPVGRAARGRRRAASSRFRAQGDKGGEATSSRCSPDIFNLSSRPWLLPLHLARIEMPGAGDAGENDAIAFIKAHPDWRPEYQEDDEGKEKG